MESRTRYESPVNSEANALAALLVGFFFGVVSWVTLRLGEQASGDIAAPAIILGFASASAAACCVMLALIWVIASVFRGGDA